MKRNFNVVVKDSDGRPHVRSVMKFDDKGLPVLEKDAAGNMKQAFSHFEEMTLRTYAVDCLAGRWKGEEDMTPKQAVERMKLHDKLVFAPDGVVDLTQDEANILMKAMECQRGSPIVLARMQILIDTDPPAVQASAGADAESRN